MTETPIGAGRSSFQDIDSNKLFSEIHLKEDMTFLDVACGRGAYSIAAARHIGEKGVIHAVDKWEEGIEHLKKEISERNIQSIRATVADVSRKLPLETASVDVCLMAMVLHDLFRDGKGEGALKEVQRVVKPEGVLAVVEFKKIDGPPGPPIDMKISPKELEAVLSPYGFRVKQTMEIGSIRYLSIFTKSPA